MAKKKPVGKPSRREQFEWQWEEGELHRITARAVNYGVTLSICELTFCESKSVWLLNWVNPSVKLTGADMLEIIEYVKVLGNKPLYDDGLGGDE